MSRIGLPRPRPALVHTTSRPGADLPHAWLTTDHRRRVSALDLGGQGVTVFTGIGRDSWVRAASAASETAAEAVLEHVLRTILDTTGLQRSKGARA